jgi:hypothetical protein
MRKPSLGLVVSLAGLVVLASSCRSILGITPGKDGTNGNGGSAGTVDGTGGTGLSDTGGSDQATGGDGGPASGGKGSGGKGSGGTSAIAGSSSAEGGEAGAAPAALLPAGACADCMARDCPAELAACQADSSCVAGVPDWLGCMDPDAGTCVTSDAGALQDFENCGVRSCDLCQHLTDDAPTIEILSPSNGAQIVVDANQRFEATVRVNKFKVQSLAVTCGTDVNCGHIHFNLDDEDNNNCRVSLFYNQYVFTVDADNIADSFADARFCRVPVYGKTVTFSASLSDHASHADRVPAVKATVFVTLTPPPPPPP